MSQRRHGLRAVFDAFRLSDGETWARSRIDFGGLPEVVCTFLQTAAAAADIPVTRLLGQSPAGLSATSDSFEDPQRSNGSVT